MDGAFPSQSFRANHSLPIDLPDEILDQKLARLHAAGRAEHPELELPLPAFARHAGACTNHPRFTDLDAWLDASPGADLYLAAACALGLPAAIATFESRYLSQLPAYLRSLALAPSDFDEVRQRVRTHILVAAAGEAPRIARFSGEGPLGAWVRVVALQLGRTFRREQGRHESDADPGDERLGEVALDADPELDLIKRRHREEFAEAFRDALAVQSPETRNLLRLYFIDGLTIDRLGALFGVHRASAHRWVDRARKAVADETLRLLRERLRLDTAGVDSFMRAIASGFDMSLGSALRQVEG